MKAFQHDIRSLLREDKMRRGKQECFNGTTHTAYVQNVAQNLLKKKWSEGG